MSAAPALMVPGSRVLLGWWRELADLHPQQLWCSRLLLHHVEALVRVAHPRPLDALEKALLRTIALSPTPENALPGEGLRLDRRLLAGWLRRLNDQGLIQRINKGKWEQTERGREALAKGRYTAYTEERRAFYFLDNVPLDRPPHFVALNRPFTEPLPSMEGWQFDVKELDTCIHRPPEWKARFHFPSAVEAVAASAEESWRQVTLDRPEQLVLVLIRLPGEAGVWQGFAVRPEGWVLERSHPVLTLGAEVVELLPELAEEVPMEVWQQAWQDWCQPRSLPVAEVKACHLERRGHRLVVRAPQKLFDRLRSARSDAVKGEAWLLAGDGRTRTAAQIEVIGQSP
jgi:hypothetical protein